MIQRIVMLLAALAAAAAAAAVSVVAAALAVYALARPWVGEAGAAAIVAGVFALLVGLLAVFAAGRARGKGPAVRFDQGGLAGRLTELAKARPWAAAGVAVTAAVVAARNPAVMGAVARAFFDGMNRPKPPKR